MELVEGKTLLEAVREGPLSEKDVVRLGSQLARGLAVAHEHGVIHRDLKPGNLALTPDGLLKILDFGLARLERLVEPAVGEKTASTDTAVGHVVGTPAYMAPEQLRGKGVDGRTDIYGAGACLYELATGRRPFGSKSGVELSDAVLHEAPASPRSVRGTVSPGLESVILKALDKDPELRYQTAKELLVDLERLQVTASSTSGARSEPTLAEVGRRRRRRRARTHGCGCRRDPRRGGEPLAAALPAPATDHERPARDGRDGGPERRWRLGHRRHAPLLPGREGVRDRRSYQVPVTEAVSRLRCRSRCLSRTDQFICGYLPRESALLMAGSDLDIIADTQKGLALWTVPVPAGAPSRLGDLEASTGAAAPRPTAARWPFRKGALVSCSSGATAP